MVTVGQGLARLRQLLQMDESTRSCYHVMLVVFFYILSFTLTTVIENQFFLDKACTANLGYNETVCHSLTDGNHTVEQVETQKYVAKFTIYNSIVKQVLPMAPGFLLAAWSDAHGARAALLIGMVGKTVYFMGYLLNAYFFRWPLEYVLLTAALPRALSGYDIGIFAAARTHLSEATPPEILTQRLAVMETINQISSPVGLPIGSAIFTASGRNYLISYFVSTAVSAFGLVYGLLFVRNFVRERSNKMIDCEHFHLINNIGNVCHKKIFHRYKYLYILLFIMFLQSMTVDSSLQFLYTQLKFQWDTEIFSYFQTTEAICGILISGFVVPMLKRQSISDLNVLSGGVFMVMASRLCYAITNNHWIMYLGAFASSFQTLTLISVYSMAAKVTATKNRGKFLVLFTSLESATSLISSPMYSHIYSTTILSLPSTIFYVSVGIQCLILVLALILKCISGPDLTLSITSEDKYSSECSSPESSQIKTPIE